jgi:hypothetical protein
MSNRSGKEVCQSSLDGKLVWCKELGVERELKIQTPPDRNPGAFRPATGAQRALLLRGVLGWNPLVPVLLHGVLIVGGPEVGPKTDGLGLRSAAPNDDAQRLGLGEGNTAHG